MLESIYLKITALFKSKTLQIYRNLYLNCEDACLAGPPGTMRQTEALPDFLHDIFLPVTSNINHRYMGLPAATTGSEWN